MIPERSNQALDRNTAPRSGGAGLGTFAGVFTPSILTILGIILFLRLGFVVGTAGLGRALLIILLANVISILTSFSLATIATSLRVKGGGDYYLISRTLGTEYGGALGMVLFFAQSVSVAFYAMGFGEAVAAATGMQAAWAARIIAEAAVALLFILAWFGADVATRFQFVVMAVLALGLAGFFLGGLGNLDGNRLVDNWSPAGDLPFWIVFAIFFPAVTGFTQGVSMSGDLKNPTRSLPRGTFLAVGISFVIYIAVAVVFAASMDGAQLASDTGAMRRVSITPWLVDAGVIAATLSSALASFLGAPRILQSLAADRVFPFLTFFAVGYGPSANPRRGVALTLAIAFITIAVGDLNLIAPVVSMFFLISYGLLNYATWFEGRSRSPSFRPTFRWSHPGISLAGFLVCMGVMLAIQPVASLIAVAILFGIHHYIRRTVTVPRWADGERSYRLQRVREHLHALSSGLEHPRDWRPVILVFSDHPDRRARTLRFASLIEGRSGFTTAIRVLEEKGAVARKRSEEIAAEMQAEAAKNEIEVFVRVIASPDADTSLSVLLQAHGLGDIRPNTLLMNWFDHAPGPDDAPGLEGYGRYLRTALRYGCHVVIVGVSTGFYDAVDRTPPEERRIDVWSAGKTDGRLMMLFAYLMTRNPGWESARIRVLAPVSEERSEEEELAALRAMLEEVRIPAEACVTPWTVDAVIRESGDASVVFVPVRLEGETPVCLIEGPLARLIQETRITVLVRAARPVDLDAEPEAGPAAEIANAEDRASETENTARKAEKEAERAAVKAREAAESVQEAAKAGGANPEDLDRARAEAEAAGQEAEKLHRRALKARAKADDARKEARDASERAGKGNGTAA